MSRFSTDMPVLHCSNNLIVDSDLVFNRSIYDLVEESSVRFAQVCDIVLLTPLFS